MFHIKLSGPESYFPKFAKGKERAAWDQFCGVGWFVLVFQYNVFGSVCQCQLHGVDLECWWTGTEGLLFLEKGTCTTHCREQGPWGMHRGLDQLFTAGVRSDLPAPGCIRQYILLLSLHLLCHKWILLGRQDFRKWSARGWISEVVHLCQVCTHGVLDSEAHFA